jgi:hypothetical protein
MRKINYPINSKEIKELHIKYYHSIKVLDKNRINNELRKAPKVNGVTLTVKRLLTLDFETIHKLTTNYQTFVQSFYNPTTKINTFNEYFKYDLNQPELANFFMNKSGLDLNTCFYCGIDYINAFKDIGDYKNAIEFLNRATYSELQNIKGIGEKTALKIVSYRKKNTINKIEDITSSAGIIRVLNSYKFAYSHNQFTLDHVLPQYKYPFLSLCLYNLVPSCYSCNAKFKKTKEFIENPNILRISPTSGNYSLTSDFEFGILYTGRLQDITSVNDFSLFRKVKRNKEQIAHYSSIFKIDGRYTFHKKELIQLIHDKAKYSSKKIKLLASEMGKTQLEVKKLIFGKEIFDDDLNKPLHKLKRDIAKNIKVI